MILCIAACWLAATASPARAADNCRACHRLTVTGVHARLACSGCHGDDRRPLADPAAAGHGASGCAGCHPGYGEIFTHAHGTRRGEREFAARSWGRTDPRFFEQTCGGCHVRSCRDCHGGSGHALRRPGIRECLACHKGYFTGAEYAGLAPREDHQRYQRGENAYGGQYLKMLPDVHAEASLPCGACHDMASLAAGKKSSKVCSDCHRPSAKVLEHRIGRHLERLECFACHSAWAPQEYGTFFLRLVASPVARESFADLPRIGDYVKSAYLKRQDAPPLGVNEQGRVSPIRPQFIAYYGEIVRDRPAGAENRLLAAEWRAFFPHTVRRGTPFCDSCHEMPRRFLREEARDRIYRLREDGLGLDSFWDRAGHRVVNGAFLPDDRYQRVTAKGPDYRKGYIEKWHQFVQRVAASSGSSSASPR
jgi:hypothetical protein